VEQGEERSVCVQLVLVSISLTEVPIDSMDIFPPSDDLSDEAFDGGKRNIACLESLDRSIEHFLRVKESIVEIRTKK
jgi:hypothetical protein